ncbi:methionine--tRNA ligase subunit beta [Candidatus Korarchaeum cryptofilum]|jgi:methionine--tRNA ligase beta chain|uniref:Methionine--tRNA ligase n=1 Tax=Candidatus Korarchaeum cryptofilum TaxID=498846 RepID=A0A3R9QQX4_9CREN|nr:methionine--tRNA ligase subunit beta [Candidatus Korarchaeum cryptofilum]RSN69045.1 methionine--tRNA ligase subunit beta [Candidatus Korarchaeum cryptofilum]
MSYVPFSDFKKLDIRIGEIIEADRIEGSRKLVRLVVDLGSERRQLVAGIAEFYEPKDLIGRQIVVVTNLERRKFMGVESQGMMLAAVVNGRPVLIEPEEKVPPGTPVS